MDEPLLHIDLHGIPRAVYHTPYEMIEWYLEQDIQSSIQSCEEILGICEDIKNGDISEWEATGNAHTVSITNKHVEIYNEYTDESCSITLVDYEKALQKWKELITSKTSK